MRVQKLAILFALLVAPSVFAQNTAVNRIVLPNAASTGTTLSKLAKLTTSSPSTVVIAATTDTSGILGIVVAGAGTSGNAVVQLSGSTTCAFDGATIAGDYVQISSITAGDCSDAGTTKPVGVQVIGRVLLTNGSAGTYTIIMFSTENIAGGSSNCPGAGGTPNAFLVDSGTQGTCTDSSVLAGGTAGTFLYNGFTNALPGTSGTLLNAVPTQYKQWQGCVGKGLGDGFNAIPAETYLEYTCRNTTGATVTITGVQCLTDNAGSTTVNAAGNTLGALLTGAITCSTTYQSGTQSANVLLTSNDYIKFTIVTDAASKQVDINVTGTY